VPAVTQYVPQLWPFSIRLAAGHRVRCYADSCDSGRSNAAWRRGHAATGVDEALVERVLTRPAAQEMYRRGLGKQPRLLSAAAHRQRWSVVRNALMISPQKQDREICRVLVCEKTSSPVACQIDRRALASKQARVRCKALMQAEKTSAPHILLNQGLTNNLMLSQGGVGT
jgi:hypothetical protein